ncbi:MAG: hypothetical protein ACRDSN_00440, partial [Pseudonocardiaceae bacterium]
VPTTLVRRAGGVVNSRFTLARLCDATGKGGFYRLGAPRDGVEWLTEYRYRWALTVARAALAEMSA